MTKLPRLVMATNNAGKLREARAIAGDRIEILSLADIGYHHDIPETADTLEGNALIKVRAIKDATGLDCFADDTGLIVDALGGEPGVYSARYAGEECSSEKNIDLLLRNMEGKDDRTARFRTCVALSLGGEEHIFEGTAEGAIATERSGSHGFGYDPVFISAETGKCFAEMSDEAKNAISHRGRAITAMMKWLGAICTCLLLTISARGAISSDWTVFNTFDDKVENVFDTPDKTYYLVQAQYYTTEPSLTDNNRKLLFLFCRDKKSEEVRAYNTQNYLSGNIIQKAYYNAAKRYLMIVYDDLLIDLLHDDGKVQTISGLKNYSTNVTKEVNGISFDPEHDTAYVATSFGFIAINDEKGEVSSSGIYNTPVDNIVRVADRLILQRDGDLYCDDLEGSHISLDDFRKTDWAAGSPVMNLFSLSPSKCIFSKEVDGLEQHYLLTLEEGKATPAINSIGSFAGADIAENRDGLLLTRTSQIVQIDRETGARSFYPRGEGNYAVACGSWDTRDVYYAKSREGFYSERRDDQNKYTVTSEAARPNAPAVFRSNSMMYSPRHGMLVNTHGVDQNFSSYFAPNPILLSAYDNGEWEMLGLPYLDWDQRNRMYNPCGFAQDPDNPDVFYFGSFLNGLLRYDINDMSTLLHMTRSTDTPSMPGHVSVREPYAEWSNTFIMMSPKFDKNGNLVIAHVNTDKIINKVYNGEIWIWTAEDRRASTSPETFRPFKSLKLDDIYTSAYACTLPLTCSGTSNMIVYLPIRTYGQAFAVYDHNGTPGNESDDRQARMSSLWDSDGSVSYGYLYCAVEDPSTGLVWVGTDNGVFTFDPKESFSSPGKVSRIKVSRNDGTSLADYLLAGIPVNSISIDNSGRKWFALNGGGIVVTSSDGKTILQEINTDNSMLPSDDVYATCYNPDNHSMMIATSAGLSEYYLSSQAGSSSGSAVRAYPNPVSPDYYGWVTIDGLEDDCIVKITDSAGNIVRELGPASAGRLQWDVCGMDLNRVPSGVYYVLASSGRNGGSYGEVSKILVINR